MEYGAAFGLLIKRMSETISARRCLILGARIDTTSRDFAMTIGFDKFATISRYFEKQGEIFGYYIPEILGTVAYLPVDRSFHNVFHTVCDFKQELIDTHESTNYGSVS